MQWTFDSDPLVQAEACTSQQCEEYGVEKDCTEAGCQWMASTYECVTPGAVVPCNRIGGHTACTAQVQQNEKKKKILMMMTMMMMTMRRRTTRKRETKEQQA